jgi:hypothetical protein
MNVNPMAMPILNGDYILEAQGRAYSTSSIRMELEHSMSKVEWGVMLDKSNLYGVNQRSPRLSRV